MRQRNFISLGLIVLLTALALWIDLPTNPGIKIGGFERSFDTQLGLDLRGGLQVLLEADLPETTEVSPQALADARSILESRSNALGVSEVVFQVAGSRRILGEFPGLTDTESVLARLRQTGLLEFVDFGNNPPPRDTIIKTDYGLETSTNTPNPTPTATNSDENITPVPTDETTPETSPTVEPSPTPQEPIYHTVMTGSGIKSVGVATDPVSGFVVSFELTDEGAKIFKAFTSANIGKSLGIVLDKRVISAPTVEAVIDTKGQIQGNFTNESANDLAIQIRYGSLPIPLKIVESRVIGPTLGQDSLNKSLRAGLIGLAIVGLFMLLHYRLPGAVADIAIIVYAILTLALYKFIPVTLTLPAIAGLMLSTGSALDANILIFERMKEELLAGRTLLQAVELGWKRAWPSIRDSNIATLITSAILFWFGSTYGATFVKGFAVTLFLGIAVSLFTAIVVTRTLLSLILDYFKPSNLQRWFGL